MNSITKPNVGTDKGIVAEPDRPHVADIPGRTEIEQAIDRSSATYLASLQALHKELNQQAESPEHSHTLDELSADTVTVQERVRVVERELTDESDSTALAQP